VFFLATIVVGLVLVPRLLESVAKRRDDEALLLTLLGCCFFVTWIAFRLNFSMALGAFLVGILGASSDVRRRLHALAEPLRSMFAAVFFVSIGLLVDPAACWENLPVILGLSALVMIGKGVNCFTGGIVSGESVKTSVQMSFSLAQIGEFAYMVALLYLSTTNDSKSPMYQIVVGVSLLTTILNPVMIRISDPVGDWAENHCPSRIAGWLGNYRGYVAKFHGSSGSESAAAIRKALIELVVIAVLELAVVIIVSMLYRYDWSAFSGFFERHDRIFLCLGANAFMIAMFAPVLRIARTLGGALGDMLVNPGASKWQLAVHNVVNYFTVTAVVGSSFVWMMMLNVPIQPSEFWAKCAVYGTLVAAAAVGWRFFSKTGHRALKRFADVAGASQKDEPRQILFSVPEDTIHRITLPAASPAVGGTPVSLNIRAKTGASVVSVVRDGKITRNIGADWEFRIGDTLVVMGDAHQLAALKDLLGVTS
jgi:CPA2 family monovalent cation:H+ antiporter-2